MSVLFGLHCSADGWRDDDIDLLRRARTQCVTLLSNAPANAVDQLRSIGVQKILLRIWWQPNWDNDFVQHCVNECERFYLRGVTDFVIHNEPNLSREWHGDAVSFATAFGVASAAIKARYHNARTWFPGLSPGPDWSGFAEGQILSRVDAIEYLKICSSAIEQFADGIAVHSYWNDDYSFSSPHAGKHWQDVAKMFASKAVFVTEYSNNNGSVPRAEKARQYVEFWRSLHEFPNVRGCMSFVVSGSNDWWRNNSRETWDMQMAEIAGNRVDVPDSIPPLPPPLPPIPAYVWQTVINVLAILALQDKRSVQSYFKKILSVENGWGNEKRNRVYDGVQLDKCGLPSDVARRADEMLITYTESEIIAMLRAVQGVQASVKPALPASTQPASSFSNMSWSWCSPVDRERSQYLPGSWTDAAPFLKYYPLGYHTGADYNLNLPGHWDADRKHPVYAVADGTVFYAKETGGAWNGVIVVECQHARLGKLLVRYGHIDNIAVQPGQQILRGQQIAVIGYNQYVRNAVFVPGAFHLHFDVSDTDILRTNPLAWNAHDRNWVVKNFIEPRELWT